jgi:hypothetical protein
VFELFHNIMKRALHQVLVNLNSFIHHFPHLKRQQHREDWYQLASGWCRE